MRNISFIIDKIKYTVYNVESNVSATVTGYETGLKVAAIPSTVTNGGITYDVTSIGFEAFAYCTSLTSVTIPSSVVSISEWAFYECTSLTSVIIPDSVTSIGDYVFSYCINLAAAKFFGDAPNMGVGVFDYCNPNFKIYYLYGKMGFDNPWYGYPTELLYCN